MNNQKQIDFLSLFLQALGFKKVKFGVIRNGKLYGNVYYSDEEYEKIRWDFITYPFSNGNVVKILELLIHANLIEIDRIKVSRERLHELYMKHYFEIIPFDIFSKYLQTLERIKVDRINNSITYDWFFIHE